MLAILPEMASPEDLEQMGFQKLNEGELKEGLKLILRAAKKYEDERKLEDAARLYRYFGYFFLERLRKPDKARAPLLKSASLYISLIEEELSRFDVDIARLNEFCSKTLAIFAVVGDEKNLNKYARHFAEMYEDLGRGYAESGDNQMAIRAYEDAFRYYKLLGDGEASRRAADALITIYGKITEGLVAEGDSAGAADAFYRLAMYVLELFGYDSHYTDMMDTAARNYEKASKIAYSEGNLDGTTTYLLRAQYAYLLSGNVSRAKLIGVNNIRIIYQVIGDYQKQGDSENTARKMLELAQALFAVGKQKEAFKAYHEVLNFENDLKNKAIMRSAILKEYGARNKDAAFISTAWEVEYYLERGDPAKALEVADFGLQSFKELEPVIKLLHEAEGISQEPSY